LTVKNYLKRNFLIKSENYYIAENIYDKTSKKRGVIAVFNKSFNYATGFENCVDFFVFSKKYNFIDWIWGVETYDDNEIDFPKYYWENYSRLIKKIFKNFEIFVFEGNFKVPDYINELKIENNQNYFSQKEVKVNDIFFEISKMKIQLFLNYMDTDSIPFYLKNIAVLMRENNEYEKSLFYLKKCRTMLKNTDFADEIGITLLKMEKYSLCKNYCKNFESVKCLQSVGFSLKATGELEKALKVYKKLDKICQNDWIKKDIDWIENEINKTENN